MATTVTKTIGSGGGRDYSTIALWEADTDNDLVTADQIQQGECYNDSEFTVAVVLDGATTDSTRYRVLTAASGQSFQDHANKLTNRLHYDQANGVGINVSSGFTYAVNINEQYSRISRLQLKTTDSSSNPLRYDAANGQAKDCICECSSAFRDVIKCAAGSITLTNVAAIQLTGGSSLGLITFIGSGTAINCTAVTASDVSKTAEGVVCTYTSSVTVTNCAFFGVTNVGGTTNFTYSNCYTDDATSLPSGVTTATYDTSTGSGFEGTTVAAIDLRIKSTSTLKDAGTSTGAPSADIVGTSRPQGSSYDVGVWELAAAAAADQPRFTFDDPFEDDSPGYVDVLADLGISVNARSALGGISAADGSASVTFSATAVGAAKQAGDASASVVFSATEVGAATQKSDASAAVAFSSTGVGLATVRADGSASIVFSATEVGASKAAADASASIVFSSTSVGAATVGAGASSSIVFNATMAAAATASAGASASVVFGLTGDGAAVAAGSANGIVSVVFDLQGVGASKASGAGSAGVVFGVTGEGAASSPTVVAADGSASMSLGATGVGAAKAAAAGAAAVQFGLVGYTQRTTTRRQEGKKVKSRKGDLDLGQDEQDLMDIMPIIGPLLSGGQQWVH